MTTDPSIRRQAMAAGLMLTGAFHEDGLADYCDAMGGHHERARLLEIMHDSRIGTYGAAGLVMMLRRAAQDPASSRGVRQAAIERLALLAAELRRNGGKDIGIECTERRGVQHCGFRIEEFGMKTSHETIPRMHNPQSEIRPYRVTPWR